MTGPSFCRDLVTARVDCPVPISVTTVANSHPSPERQIGSERQPKSVTDTGDSRQEADGGTDDQSRRHLEPGPARDDHDRGSSESGRRAQPAAQDVGGLLYEDVTQCGAANSAEGSQNDALGVAELMICRYRRTGHTEEGEPRGVEYVDRDLETIKHGSDEDREETGAARRREVSPVPERDGGNADQKIADRASGDPGDQGEHDRSQQIKLHSDALHPAAESEDCRSGEVQR